jgi:NADH-quinone oxidoreductase subunit K
MELSYLQVTILDLTTMCFLLFAIGIYGIINVRNNIILVLISIELMFLSMNISFIFLSLYLDDLTGQVFSLFILTVAAAESAIGLAILVVCYRLRKTTALNTVNFLKA